MRVIGQEQIASMFGVAPKTIVEWQEQGLPVALRGSPGIPSEYESDACINWMVEREIKKVMIERPQDRLARVNADKIEMQNAVTRGELAPRSLLTLVLSSAAPKICGLLDSIVPALRRRSGYSAEDLAYVSRTIADARNGIAALKLPDIMSNDSAATDEEDDA